MPDSPNPVDDHLAAGRARLLDAIAQPPLSVITDRAARLRRRRAAVRAGAVAVLLFLGTSGWVASRNGSPPPDTTPVADASQSPGKIYTADGITINGLPAYPRQLPGDILDVEFADPDHGYLLTTDCPKVGDCAVYVGRTDDGGETWTTDRAPEPLATVRSTAKPRLVLLRGQVDIVSSALLSTMYRASSEDGGVTWRVTGAESTALTVGPGRAADASAALQLSVEGTLCAWHRDDAGGGIAPLPGQPPLRTTWTAAVPAADGAWWVGGVSGGSAAVAVSRDGGATWTPHVFTGDGSDATGARVTFLADTVSVVTLGPDDAIRAVYRSEDRGRSFTRTTHAGEPATLAGEPVPLIDGRLLLVDGHGQWYLTADGGVTWQHAAGLHPTGRIARTVSGYVAYRMSGIYTAFSIDGSTWRKLDAV